MWAIWNLVLRTPIVVVPFNCVVLSGIVSWLATGIAGHPRLIVGLLASTCVIVVVVVPMRPPVWALRVKFSP